MTCAKILADSGAVGPPAAAPVSRPTGTRKLDNSMKNAKLIGGGVSQITLVASLLALDASAGVKYWDNPAFKAYDADSYVQDGLVLNYDGIRNQGLSADHFYNATTWVNLGNGGSSYDFERYYKTAGSGGTATYAKGDKYGEWGDHGFVFNRDSYFMTPGSLALPTQYSVQLLVDASASGQQDGTCGYVVFPNSGWQKFGIAIRKNNTYGANGAFYAVFDTAFGGTSTRPYFSSGALATPYSYGTAIVDGNKAMFFNGTSLPTSGNALKTQGSSATAQTLTNLRIGGGQGTQDFTGTIKNFRFYSNKVLSPDELVWNRAIDDLRYFGKTLSSIPVTNAVIASAVSGLSIADVPATEPNGAYALDDSGHTFTAPASTVWNGRTYSCTGYTLETWDDATGTWGDPVLHDGELSCAATETSRVRITWQWTPGDGIVTRYTAADYVQDGLVLHYDGIQNAGFALPHSSDATTWKNLAPAGGYDTTLTAIASPTDIGHWESDGYRLEGDSSFQYGSSFTVPSNQTQEVALLANYLEQPTGERYIFYAVKNNSIGYAGSLSLRYDANNTWIDYATHENGNRVSPILSAKGAPISYITAVRGDDFTAAFMGTAKPTANTTRWNTDSARMELTSVPQDTVFPSFGIGASAGNGLRLVGTIRNYRLYNRVLEDSEIAANRVIDDYRFHGVMPVTNVVVATSHSFLSGSEKNGNYEISGAYTFRASAETRTDSRGFSYAFRGYTVEEWDAATQGWGAPVLHEGASAYEYVVGTAADKVRLTWVWEATGNLRTAADYGLEDYVASGLVLHYDGIKNVGVESLDVTDASPNANFNPAASKTWVNLADPGRFTLKRANKTTAAGAWTTGGFAFTNESASVGSYFQYSGAFMLAPNYTWQFLLDAKVADQHDGTCTYPMFNKYGSDWQRSSLGLRTTYDYSYALYYVPDNAFNTTSGSYRPKMLDTKDANSQYTYATAIIDGHKAMLFAGTEYPTDSVGLKTAPDAATAQELNAICIGGGQLKTQDFTGKIKNVRYYDRVLSPAELKRNRQVDSARYFGALAFTNVVVAVEDGEDFAAEPQAGEYAVEGEWTFTASAGTGASPTGYKLQTWDDASGAWTNTRFGETTSYTYDESAENGATVRLTWCARKPFVMILR